MTQEAQLLEDASSGFGGEQSPELPAQFLGLPSTLCYKSKSFQLAGFLYAPPGLFKIVLYRESCSLRKASHPGKEQRVQGAREVPRTTTDSKSFPSGNSQW